MGTYKEPRDSDDRFAFGKNWRAFLNSLTEEQIENSKKELMELLGLESLEGLSFLDIGSGSGLSSLAARSLGARVHSFDYDMDSVKCTESLRQRFFPDDENWQIEQGSALDEDFLKSIEKFDIVYSWGVLHHTGDMWRGLDLSTRPAKEGSKLFVAIYNDQGALSSFWKIVKRLYCSSLPGRLLMTLIFVPVFFLGALRLSFKQYGDPVSFFRNYKERRGMSVYHDWIDWIGGYPFEVASPEQIYDFYEKRGFRLLNERLVNTLGCNQFVFEKT